jgi:DNA-binding CsgD family transcriptional regulator
MQGEAQEGSQDGSQDWIQLSREDLHLLRLFTSGKSSAQISDLMALDNHVVEQRLDRAVYAVRARLQDFDSYHSST